MGQNNIGSVVQVHCITNHNIKTDFGLSRIAGYMMMTQQFVFFCRGFCLNYVQQPCTSSTG